MIRGILFDFDGTLIDTMRSFQNLAGKILFEAYQIPVLEGERLYIETSGIAFERQMEIIRPGGEKNPAVVQQFEEEKLAGVMHEKFDADVLYTFETLKNRGMKLGISSGNYQRVIDQFLAKEPVALDAVMGHEPNFEKGKAHFEFFMNQTGLKKEEILFVGDSIKDGERAYEFGVAFVGKEGIFSRERFLKEFGSHQKTIAKISEILNLI